MYVSVSEVIATAQSTIKEATTTDKNIWLQWIAMLALPELGTSEDDTTIVELVPTEGTAPKPDNMKSIIDISLYDANGCYLDHKFRRGGNRIYPDSRLRRTAVVTPSAQSLNACVPVDVSETPYSIELGTNGDKVAKIVVRFYTYPLDDNGYPLIRQEDMLAILHFIRWMHSLREGAGQSEIAANEIRWKQACDNARARKKMWSVNNEVMKQVVSDWVRQIPNFNFNRY